MIERNPKGMKREVPSKAGRSKLFPSVLVFKICTYAVNLNWVEEIIVLEF